jgi:hypothetical protein
MALAQTPAVAMPIAVRRFPPAAHLQDQVTTVVNRDHARAAPTPAKVLHEIV